MRAVARHYKALCKKYLVQIKAGSRGVVYEVESVDKVKVKKRPRIGGLNEGETRLEKKFYGINMSWLKIGLFMADDFKVKAQLAVGLLKAETFL